MSRKRKQVKPFDFYAKPTGDSAAMPSVGNEFSQVSKKIESELPYISQEDVSCLMFMGYPYLDKLALITEIQIACSESVNDIFRNGYKIKSSSDEDRTDVIKRIEEDFVRFKIDTLMKTVGFNAEAYGNAYLCARFKGDERMQGREFDLLSKELVYNDRFFKRDSLRAFVAVDPIWVTTPDYNAIDPLEPNFYRPDNWIISGKYAGASGVDNPKSVVNADAYTVSRSRMEQLVLYPVPDLYKPSYQFGGLALSQMMYPYIKNYIDVRDDIPRIVKTYRTQIWYTNMLSILEDKGAFLSRIKSFAYGRDNFGVLAADKNEEKIEQVNTSLAGLAEIQDALLNLISVPSRLSVVAFTGEQKKSGGLGSGESPERVAQQEHVAGKQRSSYLPMMMWILKIICFNAFGEWYEDLYIDFNPLEEMDEKEIAELNAKNIEALGELIDRQVITPEQAFDILSADEKSPLSGIEYENILSGDEEGFEEDEDFEDEQADYERLPRGAL